MGTFADYTGKREIPEKKQELFAKQMEKILNYGGMMGFDVINMFNCEVGLLRPFQLESGKGSFHYNYFEDNAWETVNFRASDGYFVSGKTGTAEFCDVVIAAYMLYELYDETPGFVEVNGDIIYSPYVVGWLNHLLGTEFSMKKRFNLWTNAESYVMNKIEVGYEAELSCGELMDMIPSWLRYEACGTEFADLMYIIYGTDSLDAEEIREGTYPADIRRCRAAVRELLDTSEGEEGEDPLDLLLTAARADFDTRSRMSKGQLPVDERLSEVAAMSLILPARVLIYLAAEHLELEFWDIWTQVMDDVYHDEQMKKYAPKTLEAERRQAIEAPIAPVRTSMYLRQDGCFTFFDNPEELRGKANYYLSDDDRLFWWSASSNEVIISKETDQWLKELAMRHAGIMKSLTWPEGNSDESFIKEFLTLFSEIESYYKRIYPFQSMFYEFVANSSRKEYRAAVELLRQLAEENREDGRIIEKIRGSWDVTSKNVTCNIARLRLKRYLSVLANPELRSAYFRF